MIVTAPSSSASWLISLCIPRSWPANWPLVLYVSRAETTFPHGQSRFTFSNNNNNNISILRVSRQLATDCAAFGNLVAVQKASDDISYKDTHTHTHR